jgi:hypothetical protein
MAFGKGRKELDRLGRLASDRAVFVFQRGMAELPNR